MRNYKRYISISLLDTDECSSGLHTCAASEACINEVGGYRCDRSPGDGLDQDTSTDGDEAGLTDNTIPDSTYTRSPLPTSLDAHKG